MAEHLPEVVTDDPAAISDLTDEAMEAADREGIEVSEIYEEVGSVFEVIAQAMRHRDGSLPDNDRAEFNLLASRLSREANLAETQARDLIRDIAEMANRLRPINPTSGPTVPHWGALG
jgi:hypothetical protein